ncbi:MAG: hypothetical protein L0387_16345 [Acidobacteria bacterium]|nr:hypothetical protein [Acidobacteriota bacterium]MCI0724577.1 hypothetical protein [Acidobacteriota bacterium]
MVLAVATSGMLAARVELYGPSGSLVVTNGVGNTSTVSARLTLTGTYTILVRDFGLQNPGAYDLNLQFTSGRCGASIGCGQTLSATLSSRAQQNAHVLCAATGQAVVISARSTSGTLSARAELYGPTGNLIVTNGVGNTPTVSVTLSTGGTHTIIVRDFGYNDTGSYNVNLACTGGPLSPFMISSSSQVFDSTGGSGAVNVSVGAGCGWTAASNASWITVTSGSSGSGSGTVRFSIPANSTGSARLGTLTIAGFAFWVVQNRLGGADSKLFVPIVLSAPGLNNSYFTSELAMSNRGSQNAVLSLTYVAAFGEGSGASATVLPAGQQRIVGDAIAYLKSLGIPISDTGSRGGTLILRFVGLASAADASATVRTTTPVVDGRAGLAYAGLPLQSALTGPAYLCGLRQNSSDRSNVAVQNVGTVSDGSIVLRLNVYSGDPPLAVPVPLPDITLGPGEFFQVSGVLNSSGLALAQGFVRVERVSGTAPYYAYAVINDQANSDGSFIPPIPHDAYAGRSRLTLPAVVETAFFNSELVLTNTSANRKTVRLDYVADAIQADRSTSSLTLVLEPGQQSILPSFVQYLRENGTPAPGPPGLSYVGALFATVDAGDVSEIVLGARTSTPGGGGRYGLFYLAVPSGAAGNSSGWVYGLQQNVETRSNLALVNTGEVDDQPDTFSIELFDGGNGAKVSTFEVTVAARHWLQIGTVLAIYAPATTQGYARVTRIRGSNPFIVYGVINDGAQPGQRSGDGAFVPGSYDSPPIPISNLGPSQIAVNGRQLLVSRRNPDGTLAPAAPYIIKGVSWSPASKGTNTSTTDPNNAAIRRPEFALWSTVDAALMKGMNVNTVRMYIDSGTDNSGLAVLDELYRNGIMAIMTVDNAINDQARAQQVVNFYKNHAAVLMWSLGTEWNINHYYGAASSVQDAAQKTQLAAALIKSLDPAHPVASSYGDIDIDTTGKRLVDTQNYVNNVCVSVDVWGINAYRGITFGTLFTQWKSISSKPMFVGEFGTDALRSTSLSNPPAANIDEVMQASWDLSLWNEIHRNLSATNAANAVLGGAVFEWNDEWWKVQPAGSQQTGGFVFMNAHPDNFANEEYFGIVDIERRPRQSYTTLKAAFDPAYQPAN